MPFMASLNFSSLILKIEYLKGIKNNLKSEEKKDDNAVNCSNGGRGGEIVSGKICNVKSGEEKSLLYSTNN